MKSQPRRLEQLGALMTAMIAVIVGGTSGMMLKPPPSYSTHAELADIDLSDFQRGGRYFGVYARVARKLKVSRPLVTYTARGKGTRRILEAILEEIRITDAAAAPTDIPSLTKAELSHFRTGKYRGIFSRVAQSLGMDTQNVWRVGHGEKSRRVLTAIRAEMARVDAEIASENGGQRK